MLARFLAHNNREVKQLYNDGDGNKDGKKATDLN